MKELTTKQKAQRYDEAIERAKKWHNAPNIDKIPTYGNRVIEEIFPELAESENENIRNFISNELACLRATDEKGSDRYEELTNAIAWLEKQGESKSYSWKPTKEQLEALDYAYNSCSDTERGNYYEGVLETLIEDLHRLEKQGEQPRYSIGDVLCDKSCTTLNKESQPNFEIVDIRNGMYICDKCSFPISQQDEYELVAKKIGQKPSDKVEPKFKVGDRIYLKPEHRMPNDDTPIADTIHEIIAIDDKHYRFEGSFIFIEDQDKFELVEQKSAWSEEDEKERKRVVGLLEGWLSTFKETCYAEDCKCGINWLKSLMPQPKQEWSQNDIDMIDWLIRCCEKEHEELCNDKYGHQDIVSDLKRDCRKKWDWLESLKNRVAPQNQWNPTEEQMDAIRYVTNFDYGGYKATLVSLYEQLKKLRGGDV